ncbi:HNH endonuclease [Cyclobacterium plantarum]|uniref:HNH endonuclease n=1 Tax=Cyclobacterium plantarum TaxID=2716263 RepID=UPI003F70F576
MIPKCFICETELLPEKIVTKEKRELKEYKHKEHIIPNAIGGKLTSDKILCAKCGGNFGADIDSALVQHCQNFSTLLNIRRDRGSNQDIIAHKRSGEKIIISSSGEIKPKIEGKLEIPLKSDGKPNSIIVKSKQELKMVKGILSKEYPDYRYKIEEKDIYENDVLNIPYTISEDAYRGICKIAVEYYLEHCGSKEKIQHLLPYMKKEKGDKQHPVHLFYPKKELNIDNKVYHLIHIKGRKEEKILFAYIRLFGVTSFFVALNWGNYFGEDFEQNYLFDLEYSQLHDIKNLNFDYLLANDFLGNVQSDYNAGKSYLYRDDMAKIFFERVSLFEKFVELKRKDIKFVNSDIQTINKGNESKEL